MPIIQILLWLPALTSSAVVLAFYFLAKAILGPGQRPAFATLFFALIPRTFSWFLLGGGLTRSFGQLFLILTAISAYPLFTNRKHALLIPTILSGTLAVLSHPETAVHTIGICVLIWWFKARTRAALLDGIVVALGVGLLT